MEIENLKMDTENLKMENENLKMENENLKMENENLNKEIKQCSANNFQYSLQPTENIVMSVIHHLESVREIGFCMGSSTSVGYVTSKSCCLADEIFLADIESYEDIPYEENSIWFDDKLCLINTTTLPNFFYPTAEINETQFCSLITFDQVEGELKERKLEINTHECHDDFCSIGTNFNFQNESILNGTSLNCVNWPHFGVVRKSKLN